MKKASITGNVSGDLLNTAGGLVSAHESASPKEKKKHPLATLAGGAVGGFAGGRAGSGLAGLLTSGISVPKNDKKAQLVAALKELVSSLGGLAGSAAGGLGGGIAGREAAEAFKGKKTMKKQAFIPDVLGVMGAHADTPRDVRADHPIRTYGGGVLGGEVGAIGGALAGGVGGGLAGAGVGTARAIIRAALGFKNKSLGKGIGRSGPINITSDSKATNALTGVGAIGGALAGGGVGAYQGGKLGARMLTGKQREEHAAKGPSKPPEGEPKKEEPKGEAPEKKEEPKEDSEKKAAFAFGIDTFCKKHGVDKVQFMKAASGQDTVDETKFVEALYEWHQELLKK